jgi:hypothetical protein
MARRLRYYEKKRGHRRTVSRTAGNVGEALFFAALLLVGCGGLVGWLLYLVAPQWRVHHEFIEHTCTVLRNTATEQQGELEASGPQGIQIEYQVAGQTYRPWIQEVGNAYANGEEDKEAAFKRFRVGKKYPCWYDPTDPNVVVLWRGSNWWIWLILVVPVSFVVIGGGGLAYRLLHWGKSAERQAAMLRRMQEHDLFGGNGGREFPCIPPGADITNSPGTKLKYRLPIATSPGWALFGVLLACVLWNGIVAVFAAIAVRGHIEGRPDWFLTLFIVPFVLVGIAAIVFFIRQFLVTTGIGPTWVEISDHPLHPGQRCRLFVCQSGRLSVNSIKVLLVCQEEATYRQGTNTRRETRQVYQAEVFRREGFEVQRGLPFEAECELSVPAGAMHSFKANHNEISWRLVVKGDLAGWPDYQRSFPVIVRPANGRSQS